MHYWTTRAGGTGPAEMAAARPITLPTACIYIYIYIGKYPTETAVAGPIISASYDIAIYRYS